MKKDNKILSTATSVASIIAASTMLWSVLPTTKVIDTHQHEYFSSILVNHLPLTDNLKIRWWKNNCRSILKEYKIPTPSRDGTYYITIWSFGEGYMEEDDHDRLCFHDMKAKNRCIEKDALLFINHSKNRGLILEIENRNYRLETDGSVTRLRNS